jgi:hypothetical protein
VAGELERRWNDALQAVNRVEGEIAAIIARRPPPLGEQERQQLMQLGAVMVWRALHASPSIPPIAWWPASWSAAGTTRYRP